jgi:hypothetical protein
VNPQEIHFTLTAEFFALKRALEVINCGEIVFSFSSGGQFIAKPARFRFWKPSPITHQIGVGDTPFDALMALYRHYEEEFGEPAEDPTVQAAVRTARSLMAADARQSTAPEGEGSSGLGGS